MSIQDLGSVGELIGALAVIATLIYLSIQTRLTRKATEETANFASSQATYAAVEAYDRWRASILENTELADIMVRARESEPLSAAEQLLYELIFERLFFIGAVSVQSSVQGATFHTWSTGDVDFLLRLLKDNPVGIEQWERCRPMVGSISPAYVEAVNTGLNLK